MSARVLAAATPVLKAMDSGSSAYQIAYTAIEAADAVMFSEAAIERAAEALYVSSGFSGFWDQAPYSVKAQFYRQLATVVAALREGA